MIAQPPNITPIKNSVLSGNVLSKARQLYTLVEQQLHLGSGISTIDRTFYYLNSVIKIRSHISADGTFTHGVCYISQAPISTATELYAFVLHSNLSDIDSVTIGGSLINYKTGLFPSLLHPVSGNRRKDNLALTWSVDKVYSQFPSELLTAPAQILSAKTLESKSNILVLCTDNVYLYDSDAISSSKSIVLGLPEEVILSAAIGHSDNNITLFTTIIDPISASVSKFYVAYPEIVLNSNGTVGFIGASPTPLFSNAFRQENKTLTSSRPADAPNTTLTQTIVTHSYEFLPQLMPPGNEITIYVDVIEHSILTHTGSLYYIADASTVSSSPSVIDDRLVKIEDNSYYTTRETYSGTFSESISAATMTRTSEVDTYLADPLYTEMDYHTYYDYDLEEYVGTYDILPLPLPGEEGIIFTHTGTYDPTETGSKIAHSEVTYGSIVTQRNASTSGTISLILNGGGTAIYERAFTSGYSETNTTRSYKDTSDTTSHTGWHYIYDYPEVGDIYQRFDTVIDSATSSSATLTPASNIKNYSYSGCSAIEVYFADHVNEVYVLKVSLCTFSGSNVSVGTKVVETRIIAPGLNYLVDTSSSEPLSYSDFPKAYIAPPTWKERVLVTANTPTDNDYDEPINVYVDMSDLEWLPGENKKDAIINTPIRGAHNSNAYALSLGDVGHITIVKGGGTFSVKEFVAGTCNGTGYLYTGT